MPQVKNHGQGVLVQEMAFHFFGFTAGQPVRQGATGPLGRVAAVSPEKMEEFPGRVPVLFHNNPSNVPEWVDPGSIA